MAQAQHGSAPDIAGKDKANPSSLIGAIDTKDTPFRKGDILRVTSGGRSVVVVIRDVCACGGRRVIDLTSGAFSRLAPLSAGIIPVVLTAVSTRHYVLPPTDTGGS